MTGLCLNRLPAIDSMVKQSQWRECRQIFSDKMIVWFWCVEMFLLCLCRPSVFINPLSVFGECFSLICRYKPTFSAFSGSPWLWIVCPYEKLWQKIFPLSSVKQLKITRSPLPVTLPCFFHYLLTPKCLQVQDEVEDFFPHIFSHVALHLSFFFSCWADYVPFLFILLFTPVVKQTTPPPKDYCIQYEYYSIIVRWR